MSAKTSTMLAIGDLIICRWPAEPLFDLVAPVLKSADVLVGHGETVFTSRGVATVPEMSLLTIAGGGPSAPIGFPGCDPRSISSLSAAGFHVITLAHNHIWDSGAPGIEDTIAGLRNYGIAYCGAGMNIDEARRPAILERNGTRFGFLSYNCTGPKGSWALTNKPGCAYVHIVTAYEADGPCVGSYPIIYTFAEPVSLKAMVDDIQKLRLLCDVLVVCLHKGLGFLPARLAMYDQTVSYAAIDAGADLVLGHHAHILKGIEQYKGKWIFHGLANFTFDRREGGTRAGGSERGRAFVRAHGGPFFFEPGGKETPLDFPEAMMTIIAKFVIDGRQISQASYLPCWINDEGQPEILKNDARGRQVFDYMDNITRGENLNACYKWKGDEVLIHSD